MSIELTLAERLRRELHRRSVEGKPTTDGFIEVTTRELADALGLEKATVISSMLSAWHRDKKLQIKYEVRSGFIVGYRLPEDWQTEGTYPYIRVFDAGDTLDEIARLQQEIVDLSHDLARSTRSPQMKQQLSDLEEKVLRLVALTTI